MHSSGAKFSLKIYPMVGPDRQKIDSDWYYWLCRNSCIPEVKQINPQMPNTTQLCYWQQDGASIHTTDRVMRYLDGQFGPRVISRKKIQGTDWPPRSPDLNPCDFFLW